jgi:hypothetical protein
MGKRGWWRWRGQASDIDLRAPSSPVSEIWWEGDGGGVGDLQCRSSRCCGSKSSPLLPKRKSVDGLILHKCWPTKTVVRLHFTPNRGANFVWLPPSPSLFPAHVVALLTPAEWKRSIRVFLQPCRGCFKVHASPADREQHDERILAYGKWETVREQPNWSNVG